MIRLLLVVALLIVLCLATLLLESIPCLFVRGRFAWWKASLICNVVTNPILNLTMFLVMAYMPYPDPDLFMPAVYVLEGAVVLTEAWLYKRMLDKTWLGCFCFSLIANAISFCVGSPLFYL